MIALSNSNRKLTGLLLFTFTIPTTRMLVTPLMVVTRTDVFVHDWLTSLLSIDLEQSESTSAEHSFLLIWTAITDSAEFLSARGKRRALSPIPVSRIPNRSERGDLYRCTANITSPVAVPARVHCLLFDS